MEPLVKDGAGVTGKDYYKELLFRKLDSSSDIVVRTMSHGVVTGKLIFIGIDAFRIKTIDGESIILQIDDVLDIS
jgi:hypothetical protein